MHYYLITGASRGLGKALAEDVLRDPNVRVLGISRHATIEHPRYEHQPLDLSDLAGVEHNLQRVLRPFADATALTLVNNAGVLGEIGPVGQLPAEHFELVFTVNTLVPALLLNAFLAAHAGRAVPLTVLNISSGAAQRPIDGWAAYCASKAALDMLTRTVAQEQALAGNAHVRVLALSPGVIDTDMQAHIRAADAAAFSQVEQFRAYHTAGELATPAAVAARIGRWLQAGARGEWEGGAEPVWHLRDLPA